jgi:hypothetical protein
VSQEFLYRSPTTPAGPGWVVDLGTQAVRLGDEAGLITEAELGAVGISNLRFDDPDGTAGHAGDAIVGLKQFTVNELLESAGNRTIFEGYIADRRYQRGANASSPSLRTGAARVIDMTLADLNSYLSFRVLQNVTAVNGSNTAFNRAAETDVQRVTALLATPLLNTTVFDYGLVSSANPVNMDAVDYSGQRPADVLNDCAQQSGKNFFLYKDESQPGYGLFYDSNNSLVYGAHNASFMVSNVAADLTYDSEGNVTGNVWPPLEDAVLVRDPSRVVAGVLFNNGSNSVYQYNLTTSYTYGFRDAVASATNLKTIAQTNARATRYLTENSTEDDRITFTVKMPAAQVNDWKEGQYAPVKFSHLPGYESYTNVRCLCRTVMQDEPTDATYNVKYEVTPMKVVGSPSGAFDQENNTHSPASPTLIHNTVPGDLLLMMVAIQEGAAIHTSTQPTIVNPHGGGAWTLLAWVSAWDSTAAIGPPGAVGFGIWARYVAVGEVTKNPVNVQSVSSANASRVWLWEIPGATIPTLVTSYTTDGHTPLNVGGTFTIGSSQAGNVVGGSIVQVVDYGDRPTITPSSGTTVQSTDGLNNPTNPGCGHHGWNLPWTWIGQLTGGGALATVWTQPCDPSYNHEGACGVACVIPGFSGTLPTIPYPANQV